MVYFKSITSSSANQWKPEGDGNEDNDFDQQEPFPKFTTYKEASYNYFGR